MKKVKVNQDICIGCGACQAIVPDIFQINEEGLAEAIEENNQIDQMKEDIKEEVMDALEGCPTEAIYIDEKEA